MRKTLEEALEDEIIELAEDLDIICDYMHENGNSSWCEKHCPGISPDRNCVKKYVNTKHR